MTMAKRKTGRPLAISEQDLMALASDYIYFNDSSDEIATNYGIKAKSVPHYVRKAVDRKFVGEDIASEASSRRKKAGQKKSRSTFKLDNHLIGKLFEDYKNLDVPVEELSEKYGITSVNHYLRKGVERGIIPGRELNVLVGERKSRVGRENMQRVDRSRKRPGSNVRDYNRFNGRSHSLEALSKMSDKAFMQGRGKRLAESAKKTTCTLNGEIFGSPSEAAAAQILQRYIPGYSIKKGETFQVDSDSEPRGIFDFVIPSGEIVEWHPPNVKYDASDEDRAAYVELMRSLSPKEKHDLKSWYSDELSLDYWLKRQDIVDSSPKYRGRDVLLVRNVHDLYNEVLSRYSDELPSFEEVEKEYKILRNSVELVKSNAA